MIKLYKSILILIIIPFLGALKNIVKRKTFNIFLFLRTFIIYIGIYFVFNLIYGYKLEFNLINSLIISLSERYLMFIFKILYSYFTNNYEKKKLKYYNKYNIKIS